MGHFDHLIRAARAERSDVAVRAPDVALSQQSLFDPSQHTVAAVLDHVDAEPSDCARVRAAEQSGKARSSLLSNLPC